MPTQSPDTDDFEEPELVEVPEEVFVLGRAGYEIDDRWFAHASRDQQYSAMHRWFKQNYCDPAEETPYNSEEGGYLYIYGGPYDAVEELESRFGGVVEFVMIEHLAKELTSDGIYEWAPLHWGYDDDYDERWELEIPGRETPINRLRDITERGLGLLEQVRQQPDALGLAMPLVLGSMISALEAFLWETMDYWVTKNEQVLQHVVMDHPKLRDRQLKLGDIYKRQAGLLNEVKGYLQHLVWHRWDEVRALFVGGFQLIGMPDLHQFDAAIEKRHHIIHRAGRNEQGERINITYEEISALSTQLVTFAEEVNGLLAGFDDGDSPDPF
jgi:hypothetical protein